MPATEQDCEEADPPCVPKWLNCEYVEQALREKLCDNSIKIQKIQISPAIGKNENFASVMLRVQADYNSQSCPREKVSYIIKTQFENAQDECLRSALESFNVFEHEMLMYKEILPKVSNLLDLINYREQLAPDVVKFDFIRNCMILEDMCPRDFVMPKKKLGLDLDHAKMVLKKVSKLHAAAAKLNEMEGGSLEKFCQGIFSRPTYTQMFKGQLEACGRSVRGWNGFEKIGEKLLRLVPKVMDYGWNAFKLKQNQFHTLAHVDLWVNNAMFRYSGAVPVEVILLDFQFLSWVSPAIDLHYFFNTSLNYDTRFTCEEELVKYYHCNLLETLQALNYKGSIPTLDSFWDQYLETSFYAVTTACVILPLILNDIDIDTRLLLDDRDELLESKMMIYGQEKIQKVLKTILPIFDQRGLLDITD